MAAQLAECIDHASTVVLDLGSRSGRLPLCLPAWPKSAGARPTFLVPRQGWGLSDKGL